MWITSWRMLREFAELHPDAAPSLVSWKRIASKASWGCPEDVKQTYANASIIANDRVVFNIGGNKYRLIVWMRYDKKRLFVRYIGKHREYDELDAGTI